jgi:hypothetical protein
MICFVIGVFCSCQTQSLQEFETDYDTQYRQLMELERPVLKEYFEKEEFNTGLQYHCMEHGEVPYNMLFPMLPSLKLLMDRMQKTRGNFYLQKDSVLASVSQYKRIPMRVQKDRLEVFDEYAHKAMDIRTEFLNGCVQYDDGIREHGILRFTNSSYADYLLAQVIEWQDSLVEQGRMIGRDKSFLSSSGWDKKSANYINAYRFVSEMEALHKKFQSKILEMENLQNRYGSTSRKDEEFYIGPFLAEYPDYDLQQEKDSALMQMMLGFRGYDKEFKLNFK